MKSISTFSIDHSFLLSLDWIRERNEKELKNIINKSVS